MVNKGERMLTYKEANNLVEKKYKNSHVSLTMDLGKKFIIALEPNNLKKGTTSLDSFFSVDKQFGIVKEYSPVMDPEEFKKALKRVVYRAK